MRIFLILISLLLGSCGGGGGGGATPITTYTYSGTANYQTAQFDSSDRITGFTGQGTDSFNAKVKARDSDSQITYAQFETSVGSVNWSLENGDDITMFNWGGAFGANTADEIALVEIDPYSFYGVWNQSMGSNQTRMFAGHGGTQFTTNPASHVSSANYSGWAWGALSEIGFEVWPTFANFSASANFSTGSIAISTSNTQRLDASLNWINTPLANFSGTLTKSGVNNYEYTGAVTDSNGANGTANLSVYGPAANSVAGSATLSNAGNTTRHVVAFGGER